MKYLKLFESFISTDELKNEINDFLTDNHYYVNPARLVELIIDKLGVSEEDIYDETTRDGCVIIKLNDQDLVKVYLTRDFVYDYGKNSTNFNDRFYFNGELLK